MASIGIFPCDEGAILGGRFSRPCAGAALWVLAATILGSSLGVHRRDRRQRSAPRIAIRFARHHPRSPVGGRVLCPASRRAAFGWRIDRRSVGRRKMFAAGVVLFAAASAWCGIAGNISQLIIARSVQGVGAAFLIPNSLALISVSFSPEQRGRAIGTWSGFTAITAAIGPVLGGWLVQHASWRRCSSSICPSR